MKPYWRAALVVAVTATGCTDSVAPPGTGGIVLNVVIAGNGHAGAPANGVVVGPPVAAGSGALGIVMQGFDAARACADGPTDKCIQLRLENGSWVGLLDGLGPGTYCVEVTAYVSGVVEYVDRPCGIDVAAGRTVTADVNLRAVQPSPSTSSLSVTHPSIAACASGCVVGPTASTITIIVRNRFGDAVGGASVTISATGGGNAFGPGATGTTDASGVYSATFSSTAAEDKTVSASANGTEISGTAAVTVQAGPVSASQSTVVASHSTVTACAGGCTVGSTASTITVTARDQFGNGVGGASVTLTASGSGNAFSPSATGTTNASGVHTSTFTSTAAEPKTISASANDVDVIQTAALAVQAGPVSVSQSTVVASHGLITACAGGCTVGTTASTITVTTRDQFGNVVGGASVTLTASGSGNAFSPSATGTTNVSGVYAATFSSTAAGGKTLAASAGGVAVGQTAPVTVQAGPVSASQSSVTVSHSTISVCAGGCVVGTTASTITVTAHDQFGNVVAGAGVTLAASGSGNAFSPSATGTTSVGGVYSATFSSAAAEGKTLAASAGGVGVAQTAAVTVQAGPVSASQSTVVANPPTITVCASGCTVGGTTSTLTVTARDQFGNLVAGASVSLTATGSGNAFSPRDTGTTDTAGALVATFSSSRIEPKTISATANGVPIAQTAGIAVQPLRTAYTSIEGGVINLYVWPGRYVAVLTERPDLSPATMTRILEALDSAWAFFARTTGREPALYFNYQGLATIAQVPSTCGAGCGFLGATGVEILSSYFDQFYAGVDQRNEFDQIVFFEFGRNFWFYGPQVEYKPPDDLGTVTTGYAVFMRFMAMDAAGVTPGPFGAAPFATFRAEVEGLIDRYLADGSLAWDNTLRIGAAPPNPMNLGAADLFASFLLRLRRDYGADAFVDRLWKDVRNLSNAATTQQAVDNFVRASSSAANQDLVGVFRSWRWPVGPTAPSGLTATAISSSQINLGWADNSANEQGFRIERCTAVGCTNFSEIATVGPNVTSYQDLGRVPATTYSYRVGAYNAVGSSGYSNPATATTPDVVPASPSGLTATAISSTQINLGWTDNSDNEQGFKIERCAGVGCTSFSEIATVGPNVTTYPGSGLTPATSYSYRVRAYNAVGPSGYSNSATATTDIVGYTWSQLNPAGQARSPASGHSAVYRPSTGRMIVFGGTPDNFGTTNDVWVLNLPGNSWEFPEPDTLMPAPRFLHSAVIQAATNRMVVFSGFLTNENDLWVLSEADNGAFGPQWHQLRPAGTAPARRFAHSAVYDTAHNRMIVFGGGVVGGNVNDVWILEHADSTTGAPRWTQLLPVGPTPTPRWYHTAVYDHSANTMTVFGGEDASGSKSAEVWILTNANGLGAAAPQWIQVLPGPGPGPRSQHTAVYDAAAGELIVFGGATPSGRVNDAWVLVNASNPAGPHRWIRIEAVGSTPSPRILHSAVYDAATGQMIVFGGDDGVPKNDTWILSRAGGLALTERR